MAKKKVNPDEPVLGTAAAGDPRNPEAGVDQDRQTEPTTDTNESGPSGATSASDAKSGEGENK
jgi:hypothetical protein